VQKVVDKCVADDEKYIAWEKTGWKREGTKPVGNR
jgi:hypothetical protein